MADRFVYDGAATFDLTRVHEPDFATRLDWAVRVGLQSASAGPTLGRLVATLRAGGARTISVCSSQKDILRPSQSVMKSAVALASWKDGVTANYNDFTGPPEKRTEMKVFLDPTPALQSALEYLWHELLHLSLGFTHGPRGTDYGINAPPQFVDEARWDGIMAAIGTERPRTITDPITGKSNRLYLPFGSIGCINCAVPA